MDFCFFHIFFLLFSFRLFFLTYKEDKSIIDFSSIVSFAFLSIQLKVLSYGATISSLKVRDASGAWREVVLGFDSLEGYLADENR